MQPHYADCHETHEWVRILLLEKVLDLCSPQCAVARGVHFIKYQLVLCQRHCQHTAIIVLQGTVKFDAFLAVKQHFRTQAHKSRNATFGHALDMSCVKTYHVLEFIKRDVATVVNIIVVKGVAKLCFRQPILQH